MSKFLQSKFCWSLILWLLAVKYVGNEPFIRKISYLDGLPSQTIYDLFNDKKGYLYLGTDNGLVRYNGIEFVTIPIKDNLAFAVNNITQDSTGAIWCKNFANQIFRLENDTLCPIPKVQNTITKEGNLKEFIVVNNTAWILTQNVLFTYDIVTKNIKTIKSIDKKEIDNIFSDILFDAETNTVYFSDLIKIFKIKNQFVNVLSDNELKQKVLTLHKNELYYVKKGIDNNVKNVTTGKTFEISVLPLNTYNNYLRSTGDELWLCSNKGLVLVSENQKSKPLILLQDKRISDIIKDHEGNIWISTLDEGLYFLPNLNLKNITSPNNFEYGEKINFLRFGKGKNNTLYVGSNMGIIYAYDKEGNLTNSVDVKFNNEIEFIYVDTIDQKLYHSHGIIDLKSMNIINNNYFGKSLSPDDQGNFLITTFSLAGIIAQDLNSIPKFNDPKNNYSLQFYNVDSIPILTFNTIRSRGGCFSKKHQRYYVGNSDGLRIFDKKGNEELLLNSNGDPIIVFDIKLDDEGNVWVATVQRGLLKIEANKITKEYTIENGLSSNQCKRFTIKNEHLWVITDKGIDKINTAKATIEKIDLSNALKGININDIIENNDRIWLATSEGVMSFSIEDKGKQVAPHIFFNKLFINGKEQAFNDHTLLNYNENNIAIHYDAILFKSLGDYSIRYRLIGFDSTWQHQNNTVNKVNFLSLPYGQYTFQIQAFDSKLSSEIIEFSFEIKKPFWLTWWFISLVIILSGYLLMGVYKIAVNRTRRQQILKEKLALSQITALRSQMNPHFLFNVLNSVQGLIYANKKNDATEYLGKFSELMRKTLEISNKKVITLEKEIEILTLYIELEAARFEDGFDYNIYIAPQVDVHDFNIPSMIIQPFVENAIKHGLMHKKYEKKLTISVDLPTAKPNYLAIKIDDNGIGRKHSAQINANRTKHQSFATTAIETRIQLLNQTLPKPIEIIITDKVSKTDQAEGTLVELYIPTNY
jgi:ligand-binding sensor domain-containing protein